MQMKACRKFANGIVYALETEDGYPIEVTDTHLPYYTKYASDRGTNALSESGFGSRENRWMIGVSCMSGCPVGCKFCATGQLKRWRNLTAQEIIDQVVFAVREANFNPRNAQEFKINYTSMGEPFLNIDAVKEAIRQISSIWPNTHHYISTIGIRGSDFTWIRDNISLQLSLHSTDPLRRDWLIPFRRKLNIAQLGAIRTDSKLKTTLNCTLVDEEDFNIEVLKHWFDPKHFFIKLSPINTNVISEINKLGPGIIVATNLE